MPHAAIAPSLVRRFAPAVAIVAAGILVYSNTFRVPFLFDDIIRIVENASIRTLWPPSVATANTPRPFAVYTLAVNYAIHGYDVWGYHAFNLAVHIAAGLCLFGIVRRTLLRVGGTVAEQAEGIALAVAIVWLVHPLQTEAVTYIIQRLESLMGLCYLATLYGFLRAQESEHPRRWYVVSIVACALGMGCKEVMATAPLVVLWYDRAFVASSWREIVAKRKGYYAWVMATWCVLAWAMLHCTADYTMGTLISVKGLTPWTYLLSQAGVIVHYLRLSVWPQGQCIDYGWPAARSIAEALPQAVVMMTLFGATIWCIFRHPKWSFLGGWFFLILAPTSSIVPIKDLAFEHRMYLPSMAVIAVVVLGGFFLGHRVTSRGMLSSSAMKLLGASIAVAVVLQLGMAAYRRNCVYATELALWQEAVAIAPRNPRVHVVIGNILSQSGRTLEAVEEYREAIRLSPNYAEAHNNLGNAFFDLDRTTEAIEQYRDAVRFKPEYAEAYNNLGNALTKSGRTSEAIAYYGEAVRIKPAYAKAHYNFGIALAKLGRKPEAIERFRQAIRVDPDYADAHNNLGSVLRESGLTAEAIEHFQRAIRIKPDFIAAHFNLGCCYAGVGRRSEAIDEIEQALRWAEATGQERMAQTILNEMGRLGGKQAVTSGNVKTP